MRFTGWVVVQVAARRRTGTRGSAVSNSGEARSSPGDGTDPRRSRTGAEPLSPVSFCSTLTIVGNQPGSHPASAPGPAAGIPRYAPPGCPGKRAYTSTARTYGILHSAVSMASTDTRVGSPQARAGSLPQCVLGDLRRGRYGHPAAPRRRPKSAATGTRPASSQHHERQQGRAVRRQRPALPRAGACGAVHRTRLSILPPIG